MQPSTVDRLKLSAPEAQVLGEAAMLGAGFDAEEARILTDHVMDAALCGYEYSGSPKLLNVINDPKFKVPRRPIAIIKDSGAAALLDGGDNTGIIALKRAMDIPI